MKPGPGVPKAGNIEQKSGYGQPRHLGPKLRWTTEQATSPKAGEQTDTIE